MKTYQVVIFYLPSIGLLVTSGHPLCSMQQVLCWCGYMLGVKGDRIGLLMHYIMGQNLSDNRACLYMRVHHI